MFAGHIGPSWGPRVWDRCYTCINLAKLGSFTAWSGLRGSFSILDLVSRQIIYWTFQPKLNFNDYFWLYSNCFFREFGFLFIPINILFFRSFSQSNSMLEHALLMFSYHAFCTGNFGYVCSIFQHFHASLHRVATSD